jgi:DNA-binding protein
MPAPGGEIKRPTKMVIERWGKADERGRETTEIDRKRVIPQVDYKKIVLEIAV